MGSDEADSASSWGAREVLAAAFVTIATSALLGSLLLAATGSEDSQAASLTTVALLQTTLWAGMVGSMVVILRRKHGRLPTQLGLRFRPLDVPLGIALGISSQLLLVPLVSRPWAALLGRSTDELKDPACRLAEKADDPVGVALLVLITVVGAPFVEELFFRGFVQRGLTTSLGRVVGVLLTAGIFGLIHFQSLQLPALVAFGLVLGLTVDRTRRLGLAVITHSAFNATTIVSLLLLSSSLESQCQTALEASL